MLDKELVQEAMAVFLVAVIFYQDAQETVVIILMGFTTNMLKLVIESNGIPGGTYM